MKHDTDQKKRVIPTPKTNSQESLYKSDSQKPSCLCEPELAYAAKRQGAYTLEDYYKIPDERRVELIDGVIYDMSSPTAAHQLIGGFIYSKMLDFAASKKETCLPLIAPFDVQLDCDNRTMVQPDVMIVCDRDKIIQRCVYGAPDFIIEILSPSTRKKDITIKLSKYSNAGVREYWMIDPDKKQIWVYDFSQEEFPALYGFDDTIPVAVWNGDFSIDFKEVYEHVRFLYERESQH